MNLFPARSSVTHISGLGSKTAERQKDASRVLPASSSQSGVLRTSNAPCSTCITTQPPQSDRTAIEVPETEVRRAGLSDLKRCWVMVDEYNYDVAERSWYIEPDESVLGRFSKTFMMKVAASFGEASRKSGRRVNRLD